MRRRRRGPGAAGSRRQQGADAEVRRSLEQEGGRRGRVVGCHLVRGLGRASRRRRGGAGYHVGLVEPHGCR